MAPTPSSKPDSPGKRPEDADRLVTQTEQVTTGYVGPVGNDRLAAGSRPLAEYQLVERLGQGGFGEVWKAVGPGGFPVALKFIRLADKGASVELRSVELMKGIRHPHLLGLHGAWQLDDMLVVAMELGDQTLLDRLKECQAQGLPGIPAKELLCYMREAAKGIDHLNQIGVQHRDIKPQNILLVGGGVRVADFGLAKLLENPLSTNTGAMTPAYAAPEFLDRKTSTASDQYSLAVSYCQLRGGRLPFMGSPSQIMSGHMKDTPDLTMLPEAERPVVGRAMAKKPGDRWSSCADFAEALAASESHSGATYTFDTFRSTTNEQSLLTTRAYPVGRWWLKPVALLAVLLATVAILLLRPWKQLPPANQAGSPSGAQEQTAPNEEQPALVEVVRGAVRVVSDDRVLPAKGGSTLPIGQSLEIGPDSTATLAWADGTKVEIGPDALVTQPRNDGGGKRLNFASVTHVRATVPPQGTGRAVLIRAPHVDVSIVRGRAQVRSNREATCVRLDEGIAKVVRLADSKEVSLATNQYALVATERPEEFEAKPRALGWRLVDDFEHGNEVNFWPWNSKVSFVSPGRVGKKAIQVEYDVKGFSPLGFFWTFAPPQDWGTSSHSLFFWFRGGKTGHDVSLMLQERAHQTAGSLNFRFKDNFTGWRQFRIPLSSFERAKALDGSLPKDKFNLRRISMITGMLIPSEAAKGSFALDQVEILDHELLADPPE
jgi:serine/threonine protein kinase